MLSVLMVDVPPFHVLLRAHLDAMGLDQSALAKRSGLSVPFVSQLLNGKRKLHRKHIAKLADVLELNGRRRTIFIVAAYFGRIPEDDRADFFAGLRDLGL